MYSCDQCKKLRNGLKICRLLELPEVLSIHLKRFRHDVMFSSKISTRVTFPLVDLDLKPFLHDSCGSRTSRYDLIGVINHSGVAEGGHYVAYCKNPVDQHWYEFDDSSVTRVSEPQVTCVEAYVLFYQKQDFAVETVRNHVERLMKQKKSSLMKHYVSAEWIHKFNTFAEPGPITNFDFLCPHGGISPRVAPRLSDFYTELPAHVWTYLRDKFGGGPQCSNLLYCLPCQQEHKRLEVKRVRELETYKKLERDSRMTPLDLSESRAISTEWIEQWDRFVCGYHPEPPGQIDNSSLLREGADGRKYIRGSGSCKYQKITRDMWEYFYTIYGGGPEVYYQLGPQPTPVPSAGEVGERERSSTEIGLNTEENESTARRSARQLHVTEAKSKKNQQKPTTNPQEPKPTTNGGDKSCGESELTDEAMDVDNDFQI